MANTFIHGKLGTITIAGTQFGCNQFTYQEQTTLDDITFSTAGGATFATKIPGYNWATGTLTFIFDTSNPPYLSPENMVPGTLMVLVLSPDGTRNFSFTAYSGQFQFSSGPKAGPVSCSTNYESTGTITRPVT